MFCLCGLFSSFLAFLSTITQSQKALNFLCESESQDTHSSRAYTTANHPVSQPTGGDDDPFHNPLTWHLVRVRRDGGGAAEESVKDSQ